MLSLIVRKRTTIDGRSFAPGEEINIPVGAENLRKQIDARRIGFVWEPGLIELAKAKIIQLEKEIAELKAASAPKPAPKKAAPKKRVVKKKAAPKKRSR